MQTQLEGSCLSPVSALQMIVKFDGGSAGIVRLFRDSASSVSALQLEVC